MVKNPQYRLIFIYFFKVISIFKNLITFLFIEGIYIFFIRSFFRVKVFISTTHHYIKAYICVHFCNFWLCFSLLGIYTKSCWCSVGYSYRCYTPRFFTFHFKFLPYREVFLSIRSDIEHSVFHSDSSTEC